MNNGEVDWRQKEVVSNLLSYVTVIGMHSRECVYLTQSIN